MGKLRARDVRKFEKYLSEYPVTDAERAEAWAIMEESGYEEASAYVRQQHPPMTMRDNTVPVEIWGSEQIDGASMAQIYAAAKLPIAVRGALMPDAHVGYGLPIGGVLATDNSVIPYAVGVDIACRMRLSIFDMNDKALHKHRDRLKDTLLKETRFGAGSHWADGEQIHHPVLDAPEWHATPFLRDLHPIAIKQLGTSGGGNHFVEWGILTIDSPDPSLGIESAGKYLALLSHSGSRRVGLEIAERYSDLAMQLHPTLPGDVKHLAWLSMDSELGQEYWLSMQLAGQFASANHAIIHERIREATGFQVLGTVENHHNFAWIETVDGKQTVVHRKGATPAGLGVMGVIPGSMGDAGYVVRGKGNPIALESASHGAGRKLSRSQAKKAISKQDQMSYLKERQIELLGGGLDEAPQAYKSIRRVMEAQTDLVEIVAEFQPRIVRMASDGSRED